MRQFQTDDFIEIVLKALKDSRLDPCSLEMELTESLLAQKPGGGYGRPTARIEQHGD